MPSKFFKDKNGKLAVIQWPNKLIVLWAGLSLLSRVADKQIGASISILATMLLIVWAYLEITDGDSMFRRTLGAVVLAYTSFGIITFLI